MTSVITRSTPSCVVRIARVRRRLAGERHQPRDNEPRESSVYVGRSSRDGPWSTPDINVTRAPDSGIALCRKVRRDCPKATMRKVARATMTRVTSAILRATAEPSGCQWRSTTEPAPADADGTAAEITLAIAAPCACGREHRHSALIRLTAIVLSGFGRTSKVTCVAGPTDHIVSTIRPRGRPRQVHRLVMRPYHSAPIA